MNCKKSFVQKRADLKLLRRKIWFERWIKGETINQLTKASKLSKETLRKIFIHFLKKDPNYNLDLSKYKYVSFDGKYLFGRKYSLILIFDVLKNKPIVGKVVKSETRKHIEPFLRDLKNSDFNPEVVTTDGLYTVLKAFKTVYPNIINQRCLFHIKLQVNMWLRRPPRTEIGKELSKLVAKLLFVDNNEKKLEFINDFYKIKSKYFSLINLIKEKKTKQNFYKEIYLSSSDITRIKTSIERDLLKSIILIENALPNLFHYLGDKKISKTTSQLEGYFKQIQRIRGFQHCGLTKQHLFDFIKWKIYFDFCK